MRHNKSFNHLGRKSAHRKAMFANMATSLILHKRITTTLAKAKALRTYVEPVITRAKVDSTNSRRVVFSFLQSKEAVTELFRDISQKVADRPGGYTRILKTGARLGDNAEMCIIELVDYNETMLGTKEQKSKATTRRRRGAGTGKKTETTEKTPVAKKDTVKEAPIAKVEEPVAENEELVSDETSENTETPSEETEETDKKE
jgi:large subunit ribosomal protein L17